MKTLFPVLFVTACVPSQSAMFDPLRDDVEARIGVRPNWNSGQTDGRVLPAVAELLKKPLDHKSVLRIAILQNNRLQAGFDQLGIAAGALADATALPPTEVDLQYKRELDGDGSELEVDVVQDILGLLQIGQRRGIANAEARALRGRLVRQTVDLAAQAEIEFNRVVTAQQELELRRTAFDAYAAAADIRERQRAAGNITEFELFREQDLREQARIEVGKAETNLEVRRENLNRVLGVTGSATSWTIETRMADVPAKAPNVDGLEREAIAANLELRSLKADADAAAGRVGQARLRTVFPELGVGVAATRREDGAWEAGPALRIGIPLFNWQSNARASANAQLRRSTNLLLATASEVRAEARAARQRMLGAHAEARHLLEVVLPLRERLLKEAVLQYNAMNLSTFELLQARKDHVEGARQYLDAAERYWNAIAEITALRRGGIPKGGIAGSSDSGSERANGQNGQHGEDS